MKLSIWSTELLALATTLATRTINTTPSTTALVFCHQWLVFVSLVKVSKYSWYSVDIQNTPKLKPRYCNSDVLTNKKALFQANASCTIYFQWNYVCTGRVFGYFISACGNWDSVLLKPCPDWGHLRERCRNKTYLAMWKLKALTKSVEMHENTETQGQPWNTRTSV